MLDFRYMDMDMNILCILQPDLVSRHILHDIVHIYLNMYIHQIHILLPHQRHNYYIRLDNIVLKLKFKMNSY